MSREEVMVALLLGGFASSAISIVFFRVLTLIEQKRSTLFPQFLVVLLSFIPGLVVVLAPMVLDWLSASAGGDYSDRQAFVFYNMFVLILVTPVAFIGYFGGYADWQLSRQPEPKSKSEIERRPTRRSIIGTLWAVNIGVAFAGCAVSNVASGY